MRAKRRFNKLEVNDKFEYYEDEKLKEAIVTKVVNRGSRLTQLEVITEGGSKTLTRSNLFNVYLSTTEETNSIKPASRERGTIIRGVCID